MSSIEKTYEGATAPAYPTQPPTQTYAPPYPTQPQSTFAAPAAQQNNNNDVFNVPPPPYFQPLPPIQQQQLYIAAPISFQPMVGSSPTRLRCPNCSAEVVTSTRHKTGCLTWAVCGAICGAGLFIPCAWFGCQFIPFCIDSCKDVVHTCPNCKAYIGTFDRMK